jgi:hypothetical protein
MPSDAAHADLRACLAGCGRDSEEPGECEACSRLPRTATVPSRKPSRRAVRDNPKKRAKRPAPKVGDTVMIGKLTEWGVAQAYTGKTAVVVRRLACPAGFLYANVTGIGERYLAIKRLRIVTPK